METAKSRLIVALDDDIRGRLPTGKIVDKIIETDSIKTTMTRNNIIYLASEDGECSSFEKIILNQSTLNIIKK